MLLSPPLSKQKPKTGVVLNLPMTLYTSHSPSNPLPTPTSPLFTEDISQILFSTLHSSPKAKDKFLQIIPNFYYEAFRIVEQSFDYMPQVNSVKNIVSCLAKLGGSKPHTHVTHCLPVDGEGVMPSAALISSYDSSPSEDYFSNRIIVPSIIPVRNAHLATPGNAHLILLNASLQTDFLSTLYQRVNELCPGGILILQHSIHKPPEFEEAFVKVMHSFLAIGTLDKKTIRKVDRRLFDSSTCSSQVSKVVEGQSLELLSSNVITQTCLPNDQNLFEKGTISRREYAKRLISWWFAIKREELYQELTECKCVNIEIIINQIEEGMINRLQIDNLSTSFEVIIAQK